MDLLLDANAFIWWDQKSPKLNAAAHAAILNRHNRVLVSAASVWEIAIKRRLGKLPFEGDIAEKIKASRFEALAITPEHAERAAALPLAHTDPFDRMLVAQAQAERLVIVTGDRQLSAYDVAILQARA